MQVPQVPSPSFSFLVSSRERLNSGLQRYRALCHVTEPHGLPHHVTSMSQGTEAPNNNSENKHSNNMWYAACWRHYLEWNVDSGLWGGLLCPGSDLQPSVELCAHVACKCVNIRPNKHCILMTSAWCYLRIWHPGWFVSVIFLTRLSTLLSRLPEVVCREQAVSRVLEKLRGFAERQTLRVQPQLLLKVLEDLEPWELCLPELCVAIQVHETSPTTFHQENCWKPSHIVGSLLHQMIIKWWKETYYAHFQVPNFILGYFSKRFTSFNAQKNTAVFSYCPVLQLCFLPICLKHCLSSWVFKLSWKYSCESN